VIISLTVAIATGLFFGIWPARRAANLNPIDALRHE
jgi:ABC-type antimicrobial peptide transport system permease subunit